MMSLEHKEKMLAGRLKYLAERKAFPPKLKVPDGTLTVIKGPPNAPRKSHRDYIVENIAVKRGKLIEAQLDVAIGYKYIDEKGTHIYTKPPDPRVGEYLLNQLIGKPKESIDIKEEIRLNVDF